MVTPVEKRSSNKFYDFHNDKGHSTDECMQLKKQIEELVRAGKLSHLIKEIKQGRYQIKNGKKEAPTKDKSLAIYMIRQWPRMTRQKLTQSFTYGSKITFPPLADSDGTEGPLKPDGPGKDIATGFSGETIWPLGQLRLLVTIGDADHSTKAWMDFMIVRSISPYNGIIGRPGIREIQAVPSTAHGMLKFPFDGGIVTIRSTILILAECAMVITSSKEIPKEAGTSHQNLKVSIHLNFPDQEVAIGGTLSLAGRTELCTLLKKNLDIFAWQPSDMTGVPRSIAEHRLNIREGYSPVRQKKMGQALECAKAIQAEVQKLIAAGIMREVYYHDWLSNPVMVKKHDGSWRMCVDFTDLNKACLQDCYPLLEINWKIESLCGYPFKCFLNAYKGYHQIQMAESNEEKTAFYTSQGVYCYTKMPFGLKNAGATYQRLVDRAFDSQIGRNMEVYVDDLVIKSHTEAEMLRDISETFLSAVLMTERGMVQTPVYFISRALQGPELNYTPIEKLVLSLVFAAKRLQRYFQANEAEYEALIAGLRIATQMGVQNVQVNMDSKMVANQVLGTYIAKEENMIKYLEKVKGLVSGFANFSIRQVPRSKNKKADALSKIASTSFAHLSKQVLVEDGTLSGERKEACKLRIKARQYELMEGTLYRRSFLKPYDNPFKDWCDKLNITQRLASVKHPQSNGLVERANRSLRERIKALLGEGNKNWLEELPHVLWAHCTMIKSSHGDTPFSLTYGTEAVIPAEIGMPTYRTATVDTVHNDEELRLNLDLLEEKRERAAICEAKSKMKMAKYYNVRVCGVAFRPGDFVYRSNNASHAAAGGKPEPKWEGPYEVTKALGDRAYKLRTMDGTDLPRTWNIANLKKCYL
ncbi:reverse transcriptase domain-containing protein [Tanacetum coccineum]